MLAATITPPPTPGATSTRGTAIVQAAVFDAINGIERRYTPIHVPPAAPHGASKRAAAVQRLMPVWFDCTRPLRRHSINNECSPWRPLRVAQRRSTVSRSHEASNGGRRLLTRFGLGEAPTGSTRCCPHSWEGQILENGGLRRRVSYLDYSRCSRSRPRGLFSRLRSSGLPVLRH